MEGRYVFRGLIFSLIFLASLVIVEAAPVVSSEELLKDGEEYDAKTVIYKGEVIGDIMVQRDLRLWKRPEQSQEEIGEKESAWINVRDKTSAIGVFCPKEMAEEIEYKGSYKFTGDIISVRGTFHRSCPEHGGDTDIHAEKITIIQKGKAISHPLEARKVKVSIILAVIAFVLAIIHLIARRFR